MKQQTKDESVERVVSDDANSEFPKKIYALDATYSAEGHSEIVYVDLSKADESLRALFPQLNTKQTLLREIMAFRYYQVKQWIGFCISSRSPDRIRRVTRMSSLRLCLIVSEWRRLRYRNKMIAAGKMFFEPLPKAWWEFWYKDFSDLKQKLRLPRTPPKQ